MGCFTVSRAISVRILFTAHGVFSIWRLYAITEYPQNWYLLMALFGLAFETAFTLYMKRGQDWKWFCPSVFFYLACMVPTIWFLELHELDMRIRKHLYNSTIHLTTTSSQPATEAQYDLRPPSPDLDLYPNFSDKLEGIISTSGFDSRQWVRTLEQLLLLILIVGRWMLPKGNLTHDQLSQLLLVYIGTAADIVDFFEAFNEEQVKYNTNLCTVILAIWSWSVLQFTLVFTATKSRGDGPSQQPDDCCTPDVFGIIMSIFMQDGPFLVLRMLLIFRYNVMSYTNMFFTCKNTLVCMLLIYRLIVIQVERYKQIKRLKLEDSSSTENKRLLLTMHNSDQYYNYSTKVILRELLQQPDVNEKLITYVVKRHLSHASSLADENYFNPPSGSGWSPSDYSFNSSDDIRTFHGREYSIGPGDLELLPIASYEVGSAAYTRSQTTSFTESERQDSCVIELETGEYGAVEDLPEITPSQPVEDIVKLIFEATNSRLFSEETDSDSSLSAILRVKPPPPLATTEEPSSAGLGLDLSRLLESTEADTLKALPPAKGAPSRPAFIRPMESNHQTSVEPLQTISMEVHMNDTKQDSKQTSNAQVYDGLLNNKNLTATKHSDSKLLTNTSSGRFKSMMKSGWCR